MPDAHAGPPAVVIDIDSSVGVLRDGGEPRRRRGRSPAHGRQDKSTCAGRGASAAGQEDQGECVMADKPDDSRRKIEKGSQDVADTSSAIAEKLAILERRVQETVDAVKHRVDFHYQVKQRPWLMIGGSLLVGYALGRRRGRSSTTTATSRVAPACCQSPQRVCAATTHR